MILPPVVRVFFAIDLPDSIKRSLAVYMDSLRKQSKSSKIRWARPENLHVTLQFLAEVQREDIPAMTESVQTELVKAESPIQMSLRHLHLFPDPHRPRVLVIDIAPQDELARWSALIGKGIQAAGYDIETRSFRAHLSIGRIKTSQMTALSFLSSAAPPALGAIPVNEVVLFQSEPQPDGSRYIPLTRITLGT
jgi:2'-5' RNA ligase